MEQGKESTCSKEQATETVDSFIRNWNVEFPHSTLTIAGLKKPHALIKALMQLFDELGIDSNAVLSVSLEENINESAKYYRDLLPIINMIRVVNHLLSCMPQSSANPQARAAAVSVTHFLQPTKSSSYSILLLIYNLVLFDRKMMEQIGPYEEELFGQAEQVKALEDKRHKMLMMLNDQAVEKGRRAERLEKLDIETKKLEEDIKQNTDIHDKEKQLLEALLKENHQIDMLVEQRKSQRDALLAEVARKKALRVYDADDIRAQAKQATQNVQEAEEKWNSLRAILMQKENNLKNLQTIKPSLDTAYNHLHEIMTLSESIKDLESGDLDTDSKEGELDVVGTELSELQLQLRELQAARSELAGTRREACDKHQLERDAAMSALREVDEKNQRLSERYKKAVNMTEQVKQQTINFAEEKSANMAELLAMKNSFCNGLKSIEDTLLQKVIELEKAVESKLKSRNIE